MSHDGSNCFVLTGGPGSGKSTLIEALATAGFRTAPEAGRAIIRDQVAIAGRALPWVDPLLFAEMMLARDLQSYADHAGHDGPVFFDRGIPDVIGYLTLVGLPVPDHMRRGRRSIATMCACSSARRGRRFSRRIANAGRRRRRRSGPMKS